VGIFVLAISRNAGLSLSSASLPPVTIDVRSEGYSSFSGTSMAAPHVSGVVARIWSVRPECTSAQVREAVENTVLDLGDEGRDDKYGAGLVQMEAAYEYLLSFDTPCGRDGAVEEATNPPTVAPTREPSNAPTKAPTKSPTKNPSKGPTDAPTKAPTNTPTRVPTSQPSPKPVGSPPIFATFQTPQMVGSSPSAALSFSGPSPYGIFFQTDGSTGDEAAPSPFGGFFQTDASTSGEAAPSPYGGFFQTDAFTGGEAAPSLPAIFFQTDVSTVDTAVTEGSEDLLTGDDGK
jgi:hypothetical protein